jgi:hypothetical protein
MSRILFSSSGKSFTGSGSKLISQFIERTSASLFMKFFAYSSHCKLDGTDGNVFCYKERQIKGQIAAALDVVCDSYFMQEPPVGRKVNEDKDSVGGDSGGWCDFWCRFGKDRKIDVLIEVKHSWFRFHSEGKMTFYKWAENQHQKAIEQIHKINKTGYINDHLFGAALSVVPVFVRYNQKEETPYVMDSERLEAILKYALKKSDAHFGYIKSLPDGLNNVDECQAANGRTVFESYPAVLLLWSVNKFHRDAKPQT